MRRTMYKLQKMGGVRLMLALLASLSLAGCIQPVTAPVTAPATTAGAATATESATAQTSPNAAAVLFEIDEGGVAGPTETPAGWVSVTFANKGHAPHAMFVNELDEGATAQEVLSAPSSDPNQNLVNGVFLGPGERTEARLNLVAGRHYFVREFGVEGMPAYVEFAAATGGSTAAPAPGVTVDAAEFAFVLPDELPGGAQWWQINNKGAQPHDLSIFPLDNDQTVEAVEAQIEAAEAEGRPLTTALQMPIWVVGAGQTTQIQVDLSSGRYVLLCQTPDFSTLPPGPRHWHHGMVRTFTVVE